VGIMKKMKSKVITVRVTLVVTLSILGIILGAYGSVIFQEGNPLRSIPEQETIMQI
jgi:hypothetical protein